VLNNLFGSFFGSNQQQTPAGTRPMAKNVQPSPFMGLTTASGGIPQTNMFFSGSLPGRNDDSHGDQLDAFRSQIALGMVTPNLYQPALPYTATRGWSA
jgi:hypothetical protein